MRRLKQFLIIFALLFVLSGCSKVDNVANNNVPSSFTVVERTSIWQVVYHKETKVMYVVSLGGYNCGNFELLVNPDGTPMIYKEEGKNNE